MRHNSECTTGEPVCTGVHLGHALEAQKRNLSQYLRGWAEGAADGCREAFGSPVEPLTVEPEEFKRGYAEGLDQFRKARWDWVDENLAECAQGGAQ